MAQTNLFVGANNQDRIFIEEDAMLFISGDLLGGCCVSGDSIDGQIVLSGELRLGGNIINYGTDTQMFSFQADTLEHGPVVSLVGHGVQILTGSPIFIPNLIVNKPNGHVSLETTLSLFDGIQLMSGNVDLTDDEIRMYNSNYSTPQITGESETNRIYGNGGSIWLESRSYNGLTYSEPGGLGFAFYSEESGGVQMEVRRVHQVLLNVADNSINRYYILDVENEAPLSNLEVEYHDPELAGVPEGELAIYQTNDLGATWIPYNSDIHSGPQRISYPNTVSLNNSTILTLGRRFCVPNAPVFDIQTTISSDNSPHTGGIYSEINNQQDICELSDVVFNSTNGTEPHYRWTWNDSVLLALQPNFDSVNITSSGTGNYNLLVRTQRGCELTKSLQLDVRSNPSSFFDMTPNNVDGRICADHIIQMDGNSSMAEDGSYIINYSWDFGDGSTQSIDDNPFVEHVYPNEDLYFPNLTVTTEYGCESFDYDEHTDTLSILDPPEILDITFYNAVGAVIDEECEREIVTHEASALYFDTTPVRPPLAPGSPLNNNTNLGFSLEYTWDYDDGDVDYDPSHMDNSSVDHTYNYRYNNRHNVVLTVEDMGLSFSCISTDSAYLYVHPLPYADFNIRFNEDLTLVPGEVCEGVYMYFENTSWIRQAEYRPSQIAGYWWNFGDGNTSMEDNPVFQYVQEGVYQIDLVAYSTEGCISDTTSYTITVHPAPDGALGNDVFIDSDSVCIGEDVVISNGTTIPYGTVSYEWDLGDGRISTDENPIYQYSLPGNYQVGVTRTSDQGCVNELSHLDVTVNSYPIADFQSSDVCNESIFNVYNTSYIPGPENEISYRWDFGDGNSSELPEPSHEFVINPFGNTYDSVFEVSLSVTAYTNTTACENSISHEVTVFRKPDFDLDQVFLSEGEVLLTVDPSSYVPAGSLVEWSNQDGEVISDQVGIVISESDLYKLSVTTEDGCLFSENTTVYILESIDLGPDRIICVEDQIDASPSLASPIQPVNYTWYKDGEELISETGSIIIANTTGMYSVHAYYEVLGADITISDDISIQVVPLSADEPSCIEKYYPLVNLGERIETCSNNITLDAGNPGMSYLWSDLSSERTLDVTQNGTYAVKVTSSVGLEATDTVVVAFLDQYTPDLGSEIESCGPFELSPSNEAISYQWSTGESSSSITISESGKYSIEMITPGLCVREEEIDVIVFPLPEFDLGKDIMACESEEIVLKSGIAGKHFWSTGEILSEIEINKSGTYKLLVLSKDNCTYLDSVDVRILPLPEINLPDKLFACDSITIEAGNKENQYFWSTGDSTKEITIMESGFFRVEITASDGCSNSDTIFVQISPSPDLEIGDLIELCEGETVILDVGIHNKSHEKVWNTSSKSSQIVVSTSGDYWVQVMDKEGCISIDTASVLVRDEIVLELPDTLLLCDSVGVLIDAQLENFEYHWYFEENLLSTSRSIIAYDPGVYRLHMIDDLGCSKVDSVIVLHTNQDLYASFLIPSQVTQGDVVSFIALTDPISLEYFWDFGDGATSTISNPKYQYFVPGTYTITLTISNGTCQNSISKEIIVESPGARLSQQESGVYQFVEILETSVFPNPVQDRLTFSIDLTDPSTAEINIFDMSGYKVFNHIYYNVLNAEMELDLAGIKSGMYIITLQVGRQFRTEKFTKVE